MLSPTTWNWKGGSSFFFAATTFLCLGYYYWRLSETCGLGYLEIDILFEKNAKASKFRKLQVNLERSGYYDIKGGEREQLRFPGY